MVREPGVLGRELRRALYEAELSWAAGEGLCRRTGFRGIRAEVGRNPDLQRLHDALWARVAELPAVEVDVLDVLRPDEAADVPQAA